jgi:hypothetical protein
MEEFAMEGILVLLSVGTSAMLIAHLLEYAIEVTTRRPNRLASPVQFAEKLTAA